jgi:hypothetical protein
VEFIAGCIKLAVGFGDLGSGDSSGMSGMGSWIKWGNKNDAGDFEMFFGQHGRRAVAISAATLVGWD